MPVSFTAADVLAVPHLSDHDEAFLRWQAHVDAGRIGASPPCPPDVAENRAATDAIFRERARRR